VTTDQQAVAWMLIHFALGCLYFSIGFRPGVVIAMVAFTINFFILVAPGRK
jgi:hypothetical protein